MQSDLKKTVQQTVFYLVKNTAYLSANRSASPRGQGEYVDSVRTELQKKSEEVIQFSWRDDMVPQDEHRV